MGHNLRAIVARPELLAAFASRHGGIVVPLEQRFAMIPATEPVLDSIGYGGARDGFSHGNAALVDALRESRERERWLTSRRTTLADTARRMRSRSGMAR